MKKVLDTNYKNIIGPQIKRIRSVNNITQQELSARLETLGIYLDRSSISKIERQNRIVTDYEIIALAEVLKIDIDLIFATDDK
jgi:transcriptional regulator with XRE-family HTH domain